MPRSVMPAGFIKPMLPTLVDEAPEGEGWIHEIKYDGYRTEIAIGGKTVQAFTRNGHDWTERYGLVVAAARALRCRSAVLDGEMCVLGENGVSNIGALRKAIRGEPERLVLFAFDLLMLNGKDRGWICRARSPAAVTGPGERYRLVVDRLQRGTRRAGPSPLPGGRCARA